MPGPFSPLLCLVFQVFSPDPWLYHLVLLLPFLPLPFPSLPSHCFIPNICMTFYFPFNSWWLLILPFLVLFSALHPFLPSSYDGAINLSFLVSFLFPTALYHFFLPKPLSPPPFPRSPIHSIILPFTRIRSPVCSPPTYTQPIPSPSTYSLPLHPYQPANLPITPLAPVQSTGQGSSPGGPPRCSCIIHLPKLPLFDYVRQGKTLLLRTAHVNIRMVEFSLHYDYCTFLVTTYLYKDIYLYY